MNNRLILTVYKRLFKCYGPQHWWPGESDFEVMVGAILTQSAAWQNVEKAINSLKDAGVLSPQALHQLSHDEIAQLIHPCGYYNAKAKKLKALLEWLHTACNDDTNKLEAFEFSELRQQLLSVHGIGPETADSILLYAANKPAFVIDAYTRRIFSRLGLKPKNDTYESYQKMFMNNLPSDVVLFNEYHALLVCHGKQVCKTKLDCGKCCLKDVCVSAV